MSPSKQKGTSFETLIVRWLRESGHYPYAERRVLHGSNDKGDINCGAPLVFECKAAKRFELSAWLKETEQERINADADFGVLVVKRQGHGTAQEQYAVMRFEDMVRLLKQAGY
jgi:hypothetical protein